MSLKFSRGLYGNTPNSIRSACRNSGLPAAPPFEVRFPGSSSAMQAKATTSAAIQAPIVRQGWRLHALARRSVTPASFSCQAARRNCSSETACGAGWRTRGLGPCVRAKSLDEVVRLRHRLRCRLEDARAWPGVRAKSLDEVVRLRHRLRCRLEDARAWPGVRAKSLDEVVRLRHRLRCRLEGAR